MLTEKSVKSKTLISYTIILQVIKILKGSVFLTERYENKLKTAAVLWMDDLQTIKIVAKHIVI